jgi:hypothetical protein
MTAELRSRYGINDLLPHENILNFHVGVPSLPSWAKKPLSLLIGAGDLNQGGVLNLERFPSFDVYACYPWDTNGSLRANIEYFLSLPSNTKLLCFLDLENVEHIACFTRVFEGRFTRIEGYGPHSPHPSPVVLADLLAEGGIASNIFERAANVSSSFMVKEWLKNLYPSYIGMGHIFEVDEKGMYTPLSEQSTIELAALFRDAIRQVNCSNMQIHVEEDYFAMIDTWSLSTCQTVLAGLLFEKDTPVHMIGTVRSFQSSWAIECSPELIYTKIMPNFYPTVLSNYVLRYGEDELVVRLHLIRQKILEDISTRTTYAGKAKYNTFRRKLQQLSRALME